MTARARSWLGYGGLWALLGLYYATWDFALYPSMAVWRVLALNLSQNAAWGLLGLLLLALAERFPLLVTQARGVGFMLAFDLPNVQTRDDFLRRCLRRGVMATYTGSRSVRLRPHLITPAADAEVALRVFGDTLLEMNG